MADETEASEADASAGAEAGREGLMALKAQQRAALRLDGLNKDIYSWKKPVVYQAVKTLLCLYAGNEIKTKTERTSMANAQGSS